MASSVADACQLRGRPRAAARHRQLPGTYDCRRASAFKAYLTTVRVNLAYRPLRICWEIKEGDFTAFRDAVRTDDALWGGRFNPINFVDRVSEARALVEVFRADVIQPPGASEEVRAFSATSKHLISTAELFQRVLTLRGSCRVDTRNEPSSSWASARTPATLRRQGATAERATRTTSPICEPWPTPSRGRGSRSTSFSPNCAHSHQPRSNSHDRRTTSINSA